MTEISRPAAAASARRRIAPARLAGPPPTKRTSTSSESRSAISRFPFGAQAPQRLDNRHAVHRDAFRRFARTRRLEGERAGRGPAHEHEAKRKLALEKRGLAG